MEKGKYQKKLNVEEYEGELLNLSRRQLMNECIRLKKRLCALSDICDIEDSYEIINENYRLNAKIKTTDRLRKTLYRLCAIVGVELLKQGFHRGPDNITIADDLLYLIGTLKNGKPRRARCRNKSQGHGREIMENKEYKDLEDFAAYLNAYIKDNPDDDCIDIIRSACRESDAWTYTGDCEGNGYHVDDFVTDGQRILYLAEDGLFKTRIDDRFQVYFRNHTEAFLISAFQTIEEAKAYCKEEVRELHYVGAGEPGGDINAHSFEVYEGDPVISNDDDDIFKDPVYETGWYRDN